MDLNQSALSQIKLNFKTHLTKGRVLSLDELLKDISSEQFHIFKDFLTPWYKNLTSFSFLPAAPAKLEEIYIHSPTEITYKCGDSKTNHDTDILSSDLKLAFEILALKNKVSWNYSNPYVSFFCIINNIKMRVTLLHHAINPEGQTKGFFRVIQKKHIELSSFKCDKEKLIPLIKTKQNILIAGATGSGKTTLLNALLKHTDMKDHNIILEDTYELISPNQSTTRLLSESAFPEKTLNAYMGYCMRLSPDRIILGEMRSKEVEPYLLAMNTGHKGALSTIHANSAKDALHRMALLFKVYSNKDLSYELVLKLISTNIDYVIYLENKEVKEVIQVYGSEAESIFFEAC
jgi:type IV secretion system protein VirB11